MDPIANMLTMIRNAQAVQKEAVKVPYSTVKHGIADILAKEGFVANVEKKEKKDTKPYLVIDLKYFEGGRGALTNAQRVSKPGRRMYGRATELKAVKGG
ncbi:MAG: 30S ribosomal protein S8, partial [Candidatus Spechtbacterales bacterium]